MAVGSSETMSIQSASKPKTARAIASASASTATEISLLDRLSILASILLSLQSSATGAAAETPAPVGPAGLDAAPETSVAAEHATAPAAAIEVRHLPETARADSFSPDGSKGISDPGQRLAAEAGADPLQPMTPPQADAAVVPIVRLGSSTSPNLLNIAVVDDKAALVPLSMESLVMATPESDVIISPVPATTFVFTGAAGADNFDVFVGTGEGNTADFSELKGLVARADPEPDTAGEPVNRDVSAPNGIYVNLTANRQTVDTAIGRVTVQAWQLDEHGKAEKPLAHLENIDNVTATVGNDVVVGNAQANTFTYTAADGTANGQSASYGFDIYYGGPGDAAADDLGDAVDFSRLGRRIAAAPGSEQTSLPFHADGITVDLAQAVTIASVDPETGEATTVTGSLVSTSGGAEPLDLALLAWTAASEEGEAHGTIEQIIGSGGSDVVLGDAAANTYVAAGDGANGADVFDGRAGNDTIDFSRVTPANEATAAATGAGNAAVGSAAALSNGIAAAAAPAPAATGAAEAQLASRASTGSTVAVPNGVYVNLSATKHSADSAQGTVTVQAWTIAADGAVDTALAHLANVETVVGTVGSDILVGNEAANTFVYTAADDASVNPAGQIATGSGASYGFDIYDGGDTASAANAADAHDTADFSALGSQESVAAALAEGIDSTLLPHAATGITVDLAQAVTVTTVDPETGDLTSVTGSLVSTVGGSEQTELALLAWTEPQDGCEAHSTIEDIVTSGGADAIWGNDADNTVVVTGSGDNGPVFFDGRGGSDTVDFSELSLPNANAGIEIHLNQSNDHVADPTGGAQSDVVSVLSNDCDAGDAAPIAQARDIENVVGSRGDDVIEGDSNDNVLAGGGGSDTFVFSDVAVVDGRGVTRIGHDIIRDFRRGGIDDDDHLVFDSRIFNFHDGGSLDWLQQLLTNNQIRDDDEGVIIWIDDNNSLTLQNYDLDDDSGHGLGLSAYASWIVFV
jgi:RTX calcium-binding nonapeptide repeat (4 copies)